jgi:Tol biopolymer transport system component
MYRCFVGSALATILIGMVAALPSQEPPPLKLVIAFASYRQRPNHANVYFYEHDGLANGKIAGSIAVQGEAVGGHPSLTHDGRFCAITYELENNTGRIHFWDRKENKLVDLPTINDSPNAQMGPSLTGTGSLLAFVAWNRPQAIGQGWKVFLYDMAAKKLLDMPNLNSQSFNDRQPALSGDGRFIAFTSNRKGGVGLTDIYLYDRRESRLIDVPGLNSKHMDMEPSLSADGNLIAFVSDRPGGSGGRDIYLFDRAANKYLPLPGLNSLAHEMSPSLSSDGRFIAFVSERLGGEGERDIYLYDRQAQKLLPTPGLNSMAEDFDPCIIVLKAKE